LPQCRTEAQKQQVVERQDGDGGQIEAQQCHDSMVLQQVEGLSGRGGLAPQHHNLNDGRQGVNDQDERGDAA
jgi:hypothetical protein